MAGAGAVGMDRTGSAPVFSATNLPEVTFSSASLTKGDAVSAGVTATTSTASLLDSPATCCPVPDCGSAGTSLPLSGKDLPPAAICCPEGVTWFLPFPALAAGAGCSADRAAASNAAVNSGLPPDAAFSAPGSPESPRKAFKTASSPVVFITYRLQSRRVSASATPRVRQPGSMAIAKTRAWKVHGRAPALSHECANHMPTL